MNVENLRIFLASPGDVNTERESVDQVVDELNRTFMPEPIPVRLDLRTWEKDTYPAAGRAQDIINKQIGDYEIFIGILWKRFGTPTGDAESGTEEEFARARSRWEETKRPKILFYFSDEPMQPPRDLDEIEQLRKIAIFRNGIQKKNYVFHYKHANDFANLVRPHLKKVVGELLQEAAVKIQNARQGAATPGVVQYQPGEMSDPQFDADFAADLQQTKVFRMRTESGPFAAFRLCDSVDLNSPTEFRFLILDPRDDDSVDFQVHSRVEYKLPADGSENEAAKRQRADIRYSCMYTIDCLYDLAVLERADVRFHSEAVLNRAEIFDGSVFVSVFEGDRDYPGTFRYPKDSTTYRIYSRDFDRAFKAAVQAENAFSLRKLAKEGASKEQILKMLGADSGYPEAKKQMDEEFRKRLDRRNS